MVKRDRFGRDIEKFKNYQRKYMREYRTRKKQEERALLDLVGLVPKLLNLHVLKSDTPQRRKFAELVEAKKYVEARDYALELINSEPEVLRKLFKAGETEKIDRILKERERRRREAHVEELQAGAKIKEAQKIASIQQDSFKLTVTVGKRQK